ncbi:hypothetical protein [Variovorax paradoxus]
MMFAFVEAAVMLEVAGILAFRQDWRPTVCNLTDHRSFIKWSVIAA